ncbi:hypothetical protein ACN47E_004533 [Coniothyrium glycines]
MSTPHRGLPPPSAMTLPDPGRGPPPLSTGLGSLPPAPSQWQGAEEGMKNWLAAKAEEERRKQEEEKTRQESLKLEQRKVEQSMLRESMQGGIPPHLVPIIFAGIGGGNLANISAEWIQQYTAQVQIAQQQAQAQVQAQLSPDQRRDPRLISQPQPALYVGQQQGPQTILPPTAVLPGQSMADQASHATTGYPGGILSPRSRATTLSGPPGAPTSAPRSVPQSQLPRLTTNEMNIQQPPPAPPGVQQLQQTQIAQQEQSSPSIYFHHWVPPSLSQQEKSSGGNPPATPSEYTSSPKKRKAQGPHQQVPPPPTSTQQSYTSPSFSHISTSSASTPGRRGHARGRSDASQRGPESSSGTLSRRGTISGHTHEAVARREDISDELRDTQRKQPQNTNLLRGTPSKGHGDPRQDQGTYPPAPPETSRYESHQHWDRRYMSSPKRELGDH